MDCGLNGRTYIVTGASGGLGLATAKVLAADGADLVIASRDQERIDAAAEQLPTGANVRAVAADLAEDLRSVADDGSGHDTDAGAAIAQRATSRHRRAAEPAPSARLTPRISPRHRATLETSGDHRASDVRAGRLNRL
mgnify:CR=1 FL=1